MDGIQLIENAISPDEEAALMTALDDMEWDTTLTRRRMQFGYHYDVYKGRLTPTTPIPSVIPTHVAPFSVEQVIVNEYMPGQGIAAHIDAAVFGEVAALSLGSACQMHFTRGDDRRIMWLPQRSLLVLHGPARWEWAHAIPARTKDEGRKRHRRISVTFRTLL